MSHSYLGFYGVGYAIGGVKDMSQKMESKERKVKK